MMSVLHTQTDEDWYGCVFPNIQMASVEGKDKVISEQIGMNE
jgi:hypothetical protein